MNTKAWKLKVVLVLVILALPQVFCGGSSQPTEPVVDQGAVETTVAQTQAAQTAAAQPAETAPPEPEETQPPQPEETQPVSGGAPVISVSVETNCREGPSQEYSRVGYLLPGQTSTVHGRNDANTWWYIENPKQAGQYCWLWGEYATVEGDVAGLVVVTPPPPPAPVAGYVNEEYGFYLEPGSWSYDDSHSNFLSLTKGEYKLVICYKRVGEEVGPCRTGMPAGDWAAGGHFTMMGNTFRKDLIVYENKVKVASYGGGPIQLDGLELQIYLDGTNPNYDAINIPNEVLDEVDQMLATFGIL